MSKPPPKAGELRRQAEARSQAKTAKQPQSLTMENMQRLIHELEVHQIELEMQNEELSLARNEMGRVLDKYTDLYDFAPVGYFTLNRNGIIHDANLTAAALLEVERSRLIGQYFGLYVPENDRLTFADFREKVFASLNKEFCELTLTKGENSPLIVLIEAIVFESGQECRFAVIDITERKRAEGVIAQLNANVATRAGEVEVANQDLGAFNYTVAHELRTPLNTLSLSCQAIEILCGDQLNEECKGYIRNIYNSTLRMSQLIDALLTFSSMGHVEPRREKVALCVLAQEVVAVLQQNAPERQIDWRITAGIEANGDASLLRVVLDNLLGNAWKYTSKQEKTVIEFGVKEIDGVPTYFVRDNGTGFDKADAGKLFAPFQRLPGAEESKGFGVGLATVERIIRRHGGRIWAEGEPGKGAVFFFTLAVEEKDKLV